MINLVHGTDIAIEPIDERDDIEKAIRINDEFYIPSSSKGIVKIIGSEAKDKLNLEVGYKVYFDPRMLVEIKELNLVIVDYRAVLMTI